MLSVTMLARCTFLLLLSLAGIAARTVTVYQHCSYDGQYKKLPVGNYNSMSALGSAKAISSVFVPKGWSVTLYSGSHMTGKHVTLTKSAECLDNLEGFSARPKSIRVHRDDPTITAGDEAEEESTSAPTKSDFTMQPTTTPREPASSLGNPTVAPTWSPTKEPETPHPTPLHPTTSPTVAPTGVPTPLPTFHPTKAPTVAPTLSPTPYPTTAPSSAPTMSPTASPTPAPTPEGTARPTFATSAPTSLPTVAPTSYPTPLPTTVPTSAPTLTPTPSPTPAPTTTPTGAPTVAPSAAPTPTPSPTSSPTSTPTPSPTYQPTVVTSSPTYRPTVITNSPTPSPTTRTNSPTPRPTPSPTHFVTPAPTQAPTIASSSIIDGQVFLSSGGQRIALSGATISLQSSSSTASQTTTSDSLGHYIFTGLQSGVYSVSGYAGSYSPVSATQFSVSLDGSLTVTHVDFLFGTSTTGQVKAAAESVIEGQAYIETTGATTTSTTTTTTTQRKALPGTTVTLTAITSTATDTTTGAVGAADADDATSTTTTTTDANGHYIFTNLAQGVYKVAYSASSNDYIPVTSEAIKVGLMGTGTTHMDLVFHSKHDMRLFRQPSPVKIFFTTSRGAPTFMASGGLALAAIASAFLVINMLILYRRRRGYSVVGFEDGEDMEPLMSGAVAEGQLRQAWA